jgi:hypothetical protein
MSEHDAIDAMIERAAREEQEELDRQHGQHLLDIAADEDRRKRAGNPLLESIRQAFEAKAQEDDKQ